jgi:Holliday junction resolvase
VKVINKKLGNDFEQELCQILAGAGYWVHNFANRKNGQPADIIAVKNGKAYLIDAKECTREIFPLKRMEYNQELSMGLWIECGNIEPYFALKARNEIYMVDYTTVMDLIRKGKKQLNLEDMNKYGTRLATWLKFNG